MTRSAVIVCPGRGTYNKPELGYLRHHHGARSGFIAALDRFRIDQGQTPISELDSAPRYTAALHTSSENASPLIYACAYADFLSIDRGAFDIVAVTGNSMGWYSALACAGALSPEGAMAVVNTMGTLMHDNATGGQLLYPLVNADWRAVPGRRAQLVSLIDRIDAQAGHDLYLSIDLGGMLVFAGNEAGLAALEAQLQPVDDRFPMRLPNHAAFHTPLMQSIAERGRAALPSTLFVQPEVPLVDGRGAIWFPGASDRDALWEYTLGHQVTKPYDFARAVQVATREFAPDCVIVLGPGNTLGSAVAQSLIAIDWRGMSDKADFIAEQEEDPFVLSMGIDAQRALVTI